MSATKSQFIDHIMELNPSATQGWLERFNEIELKQYLAHLQHAHEPRGGSSYWVRHDGVRAVVTRRPAA